MKIIQRGMIIDVNLNPVKGSEKGKIRPCVVVTNDVYNQHVPVIQVVPLTSWSEKKAQIRTNIVVEATQGTGLTKKSVADCLQTRPIDYQIRMVKQRGKIPDVVLRQIDLALRLVFDL